MEKPSKKIFSALIIHWLEATLITKGDVNTSQAIEVFGMRRQNMAAHVKTWKEISDLPIYDPSKKCFVSTCAESKLFKNADSARDFLLNLEKALSFVLVDC